MKKIAALIISIILSCSWIGYIPAYASDIAVKEEITIQDLLEKNTEETEEYTKEVVEEKNENLVEEVDQSGVIVKQEQPKEEELLPIDEEDKTIITKATARGTGIEYFGKVTYSGTTVGAFTINGNIAFCMEHQKPTPDTGTSFHDQIYNNPDIRKALYYGWAGPEQWSGFGSYAQGVVVTSLALSYYYGGPNTIGMQKHGTSSKRIGLSDFFYFIEAKADIPSNRVYLDKNSSDSSLMPDKTAQRSENFTLQADNRNSITVPLAAGMSLVNVSTGAVSTGSAVVKGGETFYLTAPLSMNGSWTTGALTGSMPKFNAVLAATPSPGLQDLGYGLWATDPTNTVNLTVNWEAVGQIEVQKVDAETGLNTPQGAASFVGAEYQLYTDTAATIRATDINGTEVPTLVTDETGKTQKTGLLMFNTYYLKETKAPLGYLLNPEIIEVVLPGTDNPVLVTVTSREQVIRGDFEILKLAEPGKDEDPKLEKPLAGAEITLTHQSTGEQVIITTGADGKGSTVDPINYPNGRLAYGVWIGSETKIPEGFLQIPDFTIEIKEHNQVVTYTAQDKLIRAAIRLVKKDKETGKPVILKQTTFRIYNTDTNKVVKFWNPETPDEKYSLLKTDEKGVCNLPQKLDYGNYALEEVEAPEGYLVSKERIPFKVDAVYDSNKPLEIVCANDNAMGKIIISKKDEDTEQGIQNTEFALFAKEDVITSDGTLRHKKNDLVAIGKTNIMGSITFNNLYLGMYEVVEIKQTPGYLLEERRYTVHLKYKDQVTSIITEELEVLNKPTTLIINKKDLETDKPLQNVIFALQKISEDEIDPGFANEKEFYTTDADGNITIKYLVPGTYILGEYQQASGYLRDDTQYHIVVNQKGEITMEKKELDPSNNSSEELSEKNSTLSLDIKNRYNKLIINKTDLEKDNPMQGVIFTLWRADQEEIDPEFSQKEFLETDADGNITISKLATGKYYLQETETLDGMVLDKTLYTITVNEKGEFSVEKEAEKEHHGQEYISEYKEQLTIYIQNDITKVEISKQEATTGKELPGAHLTVTDSTGKEIESWVSTDKPHIIQGLKVGETYTLAEIIAPKGFLIAQDIQFIIEETGKVQKVTMKDEYSVGSIGASISNGQNGGMRLGKIRTGDNVNRAFYISLALIAIGVIGTVIVKRKRRVEQ